MQIRERVYYFDNLRTTIIVLVIIQHIACIYSGYGLPPGYEFLSMPLRFFEKAVFGLWLSFQQGYFMAVLFLIAGYFVVGSYERKGFSLFVKDRFVRLGIPTLIYMVTVHPIIQEVGLGVPWFEHDLDFPALIARFFAGNGVMWFTEVLLVFSLLYGLSQLLIPRIRPKESAFQTSQHREGSALFSIRNIVLLILLIALFAFLIRLVFHKDLYYVGIKLGNLASYAALFIVGIYMQKHSLLSTIKYETGRRWLVVGIAAGCIGWMLLYGTTPESRLGELGGGMFPQSAVLSLWESFVAVSMCIGLLALFREKFNRRNPLSQAMADDSFAVYMFQFFVIIGMVRLFQPLPLPPIAKWILLSVLCVPSCFAAAQFVFKKIPLLKKVL